MSPWRLDIKPSAARALRRIPADDLKRIDARIRGLAIDPRPPGCKRLQGEEGVYRVRQGDWRIVYRLDDRARTALVLAVGHRRDVYR